jgi:hypothetical protein
VFTRFAVPIPKDFATFQEPFTRKEKQARKGNINFILILRDVYIAEPYFT